MSTELTPVVFANAAGHRLFGMLHRPAVNRAPGVAVVLLSPGVKGRVAPHRLYVKLARRLCDAGYQVLRFDFYGLGDSEGELEEKMLAAVYASVSAGRYVDDTITAMNWLQREFQIEKFVLAGLCGGAITGLFSGARDERVDALIGFGIPVIQYGDEALRYRHLSAGEQGRYRRGYLRKLADWKSWMRLLTFRSDFSVISKVFLSPLKRAWKKFMAKPADPAADITTSAEPSNLNPFFPPAFFEFLHSSKKMFLIFGETDRLYWDFDEKFYQPRRLEIDRIKDRFELHLVKEARHVFEERGQQQDLMHNVIAWVERKYGSNTARTAS